MIEPGTGVKIIRGLKVSHQTAVDIYACDTVCYGAIFMRFAYRQQTVVSIVITEIGKSPVFGSSDSFYLLILDEIDILVTVIDEED